MHGNQLDLCICFLQVRKNLFWAAILLTLFAISSCNKYLPGAKKSDPIPVKNALEDERTFGVSIVDYINKEAKNRDDGSSIVVSYPRECSIYKEPNKENESLGGAIYDELPTPPDEMGEIYWCYANSAKVGHLGTKKCTNVRIEYAPDTPGNRHQYRRRQEDRYLPGYWSISTYGATCTEWR